MTTRLLAFFLALIIGSPACWCCVASTPAPAKQAKHSCCEKSASEEGQPAAPGPQKDPCPCGSSMIKREIAKNLIDVPPPAPMLPVLIPEGFALIELVVPAPRVAAPFNDTGPPHVRLPSYLRQHALLL